MMDRDTVSGPKPALILGKGWRRRDLALLALLLPCPAFSAQPLDFRRLYKAFGVRGLVFSDEVALLKGREVTMAGFMAPPLKAESDFFVLTAEPMALCPFCQSDADWPIDIVVVRTRGVVRTLPFDREIIATGRLELGRAVDDGTGFVSQIRIVDAAISLR